VARQCRRDERPELARRLGDKASNRRNEPRQQPADEAEEGATNKGVCVAAMMEKISQRRRRNPTVQQVAIREIRRQDSGEKEQPPLRRARTSRQRELGQGRADEGVRDVFHCVKSDGLAH